MGQSEGALMKANGFLNGIVAVKLEDGKTHEYNQADIDMVDADVNVDIDINVPTIQDYGSDEKIDLKQLKQLE